MSFRALVVTRNEEAITATVERLEEADLPAGDVDVDIEYSDLNYKDGLCLSGAGGLVRTYPHIPGIDFSGTVSASRNPLFSAGDKVILTGFGVGERWWGGFAEKACVKAEWLVKLPQKLSTRQAMIIGTAGLTAMLAINRLEGDGLTPKKGPVLVTGASGGVGSVAILLLTALGYEVVALTGRPENEAALRALGANQVLLRETLTQNSPKPLLEQRWAGAIDSVGGPVLANLLKHIKYGGGVAALGLAGSADLPSSVLPFILRAVTLFGIDSVMQPINARQEAWKRLADLLDFSILEPLVSEIGLEQLLRWGENILKGKVRGRAIVTPKSGGSGGF